MTERVNLPYYHDLGGGRKIHGATINIAKAEKWQTPEGMLYLSSHGATVLHNPPGRALAITREEAIALFTDNGRKAPPELSQEERSRQIAIRLPPRVRTALDHQVRKEKSSITQIVTAAIEKYLADNTGENHAPTPE